MSVFKMDKDFSVILNPEAVKLIPELTGISNDELIYVICVVDYESSPFRKKPLEERKLLSRRKVWKSKEDYDPETPTVKLAMIAYKDLVFDIRRETLDEYKKKILLLHKESLRTETDFRRLKELDQAITFLQDRVTSIQHELDIEEQSYNIDLKGGRKLSQLEKWQRHQKEHREYKQSL